MGVFFMENFDITDTVDADVKTSLAAKGIPFVGANTALVPASVTENGLARTAIGESANLGVKFQYLKVPIPASKVFYATFRLRWVPNTIADQNLRLFITHQSVIASASAANSYGFAMPVSGKWAFYNGWTGGTEPSYTFDLNDWVTIEIYRAADGSLKMWANDFLLYRTDRVIAAGAIPENFVYIGRAQAAGSAGGAAFVGWQFSDIVVIDPSTAGPQYRPGRTARVLTSQYSADVVAQWSADPSVSTAHNVLMSRFKANPAATDILSTLVQGAREQYSLAAFPTGFGSIIKAVKFEARAANSGAALHSFSVEQDTGSGPVEVAQVSVPAGGSQVVYTAYSYQKSAGVPWTPADLSALKVGFSAKS